MVKKMRNQKKSRKFKKRSLIYFYKMYNIHNFSFDTIIPYENISNF